jgi:hypothetical protein
MESRTITGTKELIEDRNIKRNSFSVREASNESVYKKLAAEGSENYFNYIDWLNLSDEPNVVVLSSRHHYFYDDEDLKDVRILINQKPLNYIKQLKDFLQTIHYILPRDTYFIGSFVDGKNTLSFLSRSDNNRYQHAEKVDPVENGISSRIPILNVIYDIMDSRTNRYLTSKTVTVMLEAAGFKILNMKEMNGLTYFQATLPSDQV